MLSPVVPDRANRHPRSVGGCTENLLNSTRYSGRHHANFAEGAPGEEVMHQELRLSLLLHAGPVPQVHDVPANLIQPAQVIEVQSVPELGVAIRERPGTAERCGTGY